MVKFLLPLLLYLISGFVEPFTFSCTELRAKYNGLSFLDKLNYACIITSEGFTNFDQLSKATLSADRVVSFLDIANSATHCLEKPANAEGWNILIDSTINCDQEFTLVMNEDLPHFIMPLKQPSQYTLRGASVLVVPQTGMWIRKNDCSGSGNVTVSTGVGSSLSDKEVTYRVWSCDTVPEWIFTFDIAITIEVDVLEIECSSDMPPITVSPGDKIAVLTSGRSNDLQNLQGSDNRVRIQLANGAFEDVTVNMQLSFDSRDDGSVVLQKALEGPVFEYHNGNFEDKFNTNYFEVRYVPIGLPPDKIYMNEDMIIVEISISGEAQTSKPVTTTSMPLPTGQDAYCNCGVDKFGFANGWNYNDIWLDIVVVLDTSEAMGHKAIDDASTLIESFISDVYDNVDYLITDPAANFYTRVGVIAMADTPTVLYNLNMTRNDIVRGKATVKKGLTQINIVNAFDAAMNMLSDGLKSSPDRAGTRPVVYFMTGSKPGSHLNQINEFKATTGVIIVNDFIEEGEIEIPDLKNMASDGYYFSDSSNTAALQAFCKANCFCDQSMDAYTGADPASAAGGGCYHAVPAGVPFGKAKSACADGGGIISTVHDDGKGRFVQQLFTKSTSKSDYYWIGYEKSKDGSWQWEDQSSDHYTNWNVGEPSSASVAQCAYVDVSDKDLKWGAGNCQVGFPYVCQYAPCSVGNKNC